MTRLNLVGGLKSSFQSEARSFITPLISTVPVSIEPELGRYRIENFLQGPESITKAKSAQTGCNWVWQRIWPQVDSGNNEQHALAITHSFSGIQRLCIELTGNHGKTALYFGSAINDQLNVLNAVESQLDAKVQFSTVDPLQPIGQAKHLSFCTLAPAEPPWWRCLAYSIIGFWESLYRHLSTFPPEFYGLVQILLAPAPNAHQHLLEMITAEEKANVLAHGLLSDFTHSALEFRSELKVKANPSAPLFYTAIRLAVAGPDRATANQKLQQLQTVTTPLRFGGHPLRCVGHDEYHSALGTDPRSVIENRQVYRPGILLSAEEAAGLLLLPPKRAVQSEDIAVLLGAPIPTALKQAQGVFVGTASYLDQTARIHFPDSLRSTHMEIRGRSGSGKTTVVAQMLVQDALSGRRGVIVLGLHPDLLHKVLSQLSATEEMLNRVIYLDPCLGTPAINLVHTPPAHQIALLGDQLSKAAIGTFESVGERMKGLFRFIFTGLLALENSCLADALVMLSDTAKGEQIRERAAAVLKHNAEAYHFFKQPFKNLKGEGLSSARSRLSQLLLHDRVAAMMSHSDHRIDLDQVLAEKKLLFVNLQKGQIGSLTAAALGSFLITNLFAAAYRRPLGSPPCVIALDEYQTYNIPLSEATAELRKFSIELMLASQILAGLSDDSRIALQNVSTRLLFAQSDEDSRKHAPLLGQPPAALYNLQTGQAWLHTPTGTALLQTPPPKPGDPANTQKFIEHSLKRYYVNTSTRVPSDHNYSAPTL